MYETRETLSSWSLSDSLLEKGRVIGGLEANGSVPLVILGTESGLVVELQDGLVGNLAFLQL